MPTTAAREVFPNAPLAFVACEVRFPLTLKLVQDSALSDLSDALADLLPIPEPEQIHSITVMNGRENAVEVEKRFRFLNRERTWSAVVAGNAVAVETTDYHEFTDFRQFVLDVTAAVSDIVKVVGIERIGLRYIDEIRVPDEINSVSDWKGWVTDEVLGCLNIAEGYTVDGIQTVLSIVNDKGTSTRVRYAALTGNGVVGNGPLRRRLPAAAGPFFVIDSDSFQATPGADMLDFDSETIARVLDQLHEPVETLFHRAITDRLREEFRRNP